MAAFPSRTADAHAAHWAKIRADETNMTRTITVADVVVGNVVSWSQDGKRGIGYWIGREHWGQGIATKAVELYLEEETERPLYGHVAVQNIGSIRVLQKCGFAQVGEARISPEDGVEEIVMALTE